MEADASNHPDEGTIHAWLDEALEPAEGARIAEHVRGCAECSARVAEARGLIAGASRIVAALDDVPAGTRPAWSQEGVMAGGAAASAEGAGGAPSREAQGSLWRRLRVTPARSAIAATLIVAIGITLTRQRTAIETPEMVRTASAPKSAPTGDSVAGEGAAAGNAAAQAREAARQADHLLDSAVAKSVAVAHPQRALQARPGTAIPQAPAGVASAATAPDTLAGMQVAVGRRALQAERVAGAAERADKARVDAYAAATPPAAAEALDAARAADQKAREKSSNVAGVAPSRASGAAKQCFLVEAGATGGTWGGEALPLLVVADSAARSGTGSAAVFTAAGARTPLQARWVRVGRDSLSLTLRRLGYTGAIALGPELAGGRAGVARSGLVGALEEVVTLGYGVAGKGAAAPDSQSRGAAAARGLAKDARGAAPGAPGAAAAPPAPALAAPAQPPVAMREYPVTMRPATCPNQ